MDGLCAPLIAQLSEKAVIYFSSNKLTSPEPHYFVCISGKDTEGMIGLVCCTSQFEKRMRFIELNGLSFETLVRIKPSASNGLKKDSYVDCNTYFQFTENELIRKCKDNNFELKGVVEESDFEQLIIGIRESRLIDGHIREFARKIYLQRYSK